MRIDYHIKLQHCISKTVLNTVFASFALVTSYINNKHSSLTKTWLLLLKLGETSANMYACTYLDAQLELCFQGIIISFPFLRDNLGNQSWESVDKCHDI